jgi:alginate O-acetyltransferase complex protein AlgJ
MGHDGRMVRLLVTTMFCSLIALPLVTGHWSADAAVSSENRPQTRFPRLALVWEDPRAFFASSERYFNDRFGLRPSLIGWHSRFKHFVLGVSASPDVLLGKSGWLYWAQKGDGDPIGHFRGVQTLSPDDLADVGGILQDRSDSMMAHGATYVFLPAPNKETIHPEFLPDSVTRLTSTSHLDRFVNHLTTHTTVRVVDPRPRLQDAKRTLITYHPTDTHWNAYGAYAAYRALVDVLQQDFPEIVPLILTARDFTEVPGAWAYVVPTMPLGPPNLVRDVSSTSGDLAGVLGLRDVLHDISVVPRKRHDRCAHVVSTPYRPTGWETVEDGPHPSLGHAGLLSTECAGKPLHVLVMHDSFGPLLIPYLSGTFGRVTYAWTDDFPFGLEFVSENPVDVVIRVHVERHILPGFIY